MIHEVSEADLKKLLPREAEIITLRYLQDSPISLCDVAEMLGLTPARVEQIEQKALRRLRIEVQLVKKSGNA